MNAKNRSTGGVTAWVLLVTILITASMVVYPAAPASADDKQESAQLVEKARFAFESFMTDGKMGPFQGLVKRARGVFIAPQLLKGAFIIGVSGGSGVLVVQDEKTGEWNGPCFYTIGGASFGFQIGGEVSEVVLLAMTERGVSSLLWSSFKLGADAGLAVGPVGMGVSAASANLSADILSFSRSKGLYGGISLDGAVVATRGDWNEAYYGKPLTPTDILIRKTVINPQAQRLIESVAKAAAGK
jgi:lipid-binding SYLF domain-containing protein